MFKTFLMGLGVVMLVAIGAFVALLAWANKAGGKLQNTFFNAVVSGNPENVLTLCDPRLREQIDAPILAAWIDEVHDKLGAYRGLSGTDFGTNSKTTDAGWIVESKGTVHFEHGDAKSDLTFCNDLLTAFSVNSDKLAGNWFQGPRETKLYQQRGEEFIRKFLAQDETGATALMAKELRAAVPDDKLRELMKTFDGKTGKLKSIAYREDKFTKENSGTLKVYYDLDCEHGKFVAEIKFQFNGLKGYLEGFDFKPKEK
jgi:hypothetical protein